MYEARKYFCRCCAVRFARSGKASAQLAWLGSLASQAEPKASYEPAPMAWLGPARTGLVWLGLLA